MAGSSLANPFAAMTAGIASLWGPVHGGANEDCLNLLNELTEEQIPEFLEQVKRKEKMLIGFGHRVYKTHDPRCVIIKDMIKTLNK
jgi:citrate synthase